MTVSTVTFWSGTWFGNTPLTEGSAAKRKIPAIALLCVAPMSSTVTLIGPGLATGVVHSTRVLESQRAATSPVLSKTHLSWSEFGNPRPWTVTTVPPRTEPNDGAMCVTCGDS